jgi:A/G-specific adenine glycosylase
VDAVRELRGWLPRRLLPWFDQAQRDLPWRRTRDPYAIWISEVMLQQTQVATVVPYFERFLAAFPTIGDLARADEQEVLRQWEGLGYYRRARNLHRAAQQIMERHGGTFPTEPSAVAALPGLGRYTCNAVLSQAFDQRLPILEANTLRVLSRLFGRRDEPRRGAANRWLWAAAAELLPRNRVGAFNQALMELGALICSPHAPRCSDCPVAARCAARREGLQAVIPPPKVARPTEPIAEVAVVIHKRDRLLIVQRPADAPRWASLWEFPHAPLARGENVEDAAVRLARELTNLAVLPVAELLTVRHAIVRQAITLTAVEVEWKAGGFRSEFYATGRWVRAEELASFPVSSPQRRLAEPAAQAARQLLLWSGEALLRRRS